MTTVGDIAAHLEAWAPRGTAQSYDNVGLQVGRLSRSVSTVLVALDLTPGVCDEAVRIGAHLIITHHPVLFKPLRSLTDHGLESSMVLRLAEAGIAHYAIHTNLDAAQGGVSFALADVIGLRGVTFLCADPDASLMKLVVYVPPASLEAVRTALADSGAGHIGAYTDCAYATSGMEFFRPSPNATPARGSKDRLARVVGYRLEADVPKWNLDAVVSAVTDAHPYEDVAYDVYALHRPDSQVGIGAIGNLEHAVSLRSLLDRLCSNLGTAAVRYTGDPDSSVSRIAVCGGSGSAFTRHALAAGADVYVTGDIKYHQYFDVLDTSGKPRMALVDAGHYETEAMTESLIVDAVGKAFADLDIRRTTEKTSPMQVYVGSSQ